LKSCRQIDAIAVSVLFLDYDFAQINTNAHVDAALIRKSFIASKHRTLQLYRAMHRVYNTAEFCEKAVPHQFEYAAVVSLNLWFKEFLSMRTETFERAVFVRAHQTAIADHVR